MFLSKDKKLLPYQVLLFGALGLYLYKLSKRNTELGSNDQVKFNIDTNKLSQAVMPYINVDGRFHEPLQKGIKKTLDTVLTKVKR